MIKAIVFGAAGRMGKEIIAAAGELKDIRIISGIEVKNHELIGKSIGSVKITDNIATFIKKCDCIVDFTNHRAAMDNLQKVKDYKKPAIIGTTGFSDSETALIKRWSAKLPIFLSPNMSVGINHLYDLVKNSTKILKNFDIEIIETHHRGKKDSPSGTAKAIARLIKEVRPHTKFISGRLGLTGGKNKHEICISAIRGGDIIGEHRVLYLGDGEFVELKHYATSRRCFALGTIAAMRFIITKKHGLYTMKDLPSHYYR